MRVLIVDDMEINRNILRKLLEKYHIEEIDEANNIAEALLLYLDNPYDLVLLDIIMPVPDGEFFLKTVNILIKRYQLPLRNNVLVVTSIDSAKRLMQLSDYACYWHSGHWLLLAGSPGCGSYLCRLYLQETSVTTITWREALKGYMIEKRYIE